MMDMKNTGFVAPRELAPGARRGTAAVAALMMIVALAVGTLTAAAVLTLGIARGKDGVPHHRVYAIHLGDAQPRG